MRTRATTLAFFFIGAAALPMTLAAAEAKDHAAVSRYAGSTLTRRDDDGHRSYSLVVRVDEKGRSDEEFLVPLRVDGQLTRLAYENPQGRSATEVFANYREALQKAGFQILFACQEKECGPSYASSRWGRITGMRYFAPDMRYLAAKSSKGGREIYVAVLVAKLRHQVEVVEVAEMQTGLVTARAIADGLLLDGRVVLDGILFDTDKATIRPESKPALDVIAKYLQDNPALQVYVVGHTDGTGSFDHNLALSRNRASAVSSALSRDYGIAATRLLAHGVGPLSPQKTNQNEGGRARNRRVEMVQR
jgi:outer membrane protein OmpA-like peptidoglycan-associated protein